MKLRLWAEIQMGYCEPKILPSQVRRKNMGTANYLKNAIVFHISYFLLNMAFGTYRYLPGLTLA